MLVFPKAFLPPQGWRLATRSRPKQSLILERTLDRDVGGARDRLGAAGDGRGGGRSSKVNVLLDVEGRERSRRGTSASIGVGGA